MAGSEFCLKDSFGNELVRGCDVIRKDGVINGIRLDVIVALFCEKLFLEVCNSSLEDSGEKVR
jgi:hypothetical protein